MVVDVEHRQRGPTRVGRGRRRAALQRLLLVEGGVRLQGQLQVQDVVDDVLEDLHSADFLILRNGGHQALEPRVAVVHVVLQAKQVLLLHPAPGDVEALLGQIVQRGLAAAGGGGGAAVGGGGGGGGVLGPDRSYSFHLREPAER